MKIYRYCHLFINVSLLVSLSFYPLHSGLAAKKVKKTPKRTASKTFTLDSEKISQGTLEEQIGYILNETGLSSCKVGLKVVEANSGKSIFELNENEPMNPASNEKIITTAVALDSLGPHYTFKTDFFSENHISPDGTLQNLWVKGYGDPVFVTEEMDAVVEALAEAGLKEIKGNIYVDDSYFGSDHNIQYSSRRGGKNYTIVLGALSYNFNRGQIQLHQNSEEEADATEARFRKKKPKKITRKPVKKKPRKILNIAKNPAMAFGIALLQNLEANGISVRGKVIEGFTPENQVTVLVHHSPELGEVIKGMGKFSNNFIAEQVLRVVGGEKYGGPATLDKGLKAAREYLLSIGIPENEFVVDNGSGLSLYNRISANHMIHVLESLYHSNYSDVFIDSLSVAGIDGTLKKRMKTPELIGKVLAKTGTLNNVSTLSGYFFHHRKRIVFSLLLNDVNISHDKLVIAKQEILRSIARAL